MRRRFVQLASCEICQSLFVQPARRGRPKKYCDQDCGDEAKRRRSREWHSRQLAKRFATVEAFWEWQRSPARRAEIGAKVSATRAAARAVSNQCHRVETALRAQLEQLELEPGFLQLEDLA